MNDANDTVSASSEALILSQNIIFQFYCFKVRNKSYCLHWRNPSREKSVNDMLKTSFLNFNIEKSLSTGAVLETVNLVHRRKWKLKIENWNGLINMGVTTHRKTSTDDHKNLWLLYKPRHFCIWYTALKIETQFC